MTIGTKIRERRRERGLTQQEVADALGVTRGAVGQWEADQTRPTVHNWARLGEVLGLEALYAQSPGSPYPGQVVDAPDEIALVRFWRGLDSAERTLVLKLLHVGADPVRLAG